MNTNNIVTIHPAPTGMQGAITLPGDKSISHRSVMFAAIAQGESHILNCSGGGDNRSTIGAFCTLGVDIRQSGTTVHVKGHGWSGLHASSQTIDCGNSGTTMRLLSGLLAARPFRSRLDGDESLRGRPMGRVIGPLTEMGADIVSESGGNRAPLQITGKPLHGISYRSAVASAQVKSAIVLAGLQASGTTTVWEPVRSRDHTERMLPSFGVHLQVNETEVIIEGGQELRACDVEVPGDLSSAAFFIGAALILPGSELHVRGVGLNPTRTGVLDVLHAMGGLITVQNSREMCGEPVGDLLVRPSALHGIDIDGELVVRAIDEIPLLAVVAAFAQGTTTIRGAEELRVKESDRLHALAVTLSTLGARITELPDGLIIEGGHELYGGRVDSLGDHRIAMALSIAGLAGSGAVVVERAESVSISFPSFYRLLRDLTGPTTTHA
ncbi:MAG: 3-phosphoshikimate 1-carboxyvinyltransferase [Deltaproteobacteria bacterium]|nr:3-phosphoshikimate 1-carboxyvinyltransferase [Deltaproteobacteria bacterium]